MQDIEIVLRRKRRGRPQNALQIVDIPSFIDEVRREADSRAVDTVQLATNPEFVHSIRRHLKVSISASSPATISNTQLYAHLI